MYDTSNPGHDFDYELALSFSDGKPIFSIVELGLAASGPDLESAFREIVRLKQDYLEMARAGDRLDTLPLPLRRSAMAAAAFSASSEAVAGTVTVKSDLVSFLIKLAIVYASLMILIGVMVFAIRPAFHVPVGKKFWAQVEEGLHRSAVGEGMSPDVQVRVLADLHTLVARYKPFIDEVRPLFQDQPPKPGPDPK